MEITLKDKLLLLVKIYKELNRLPNLRSKVAAFLNPVENTRYVEFSFILKCIKKYNIHFNSGLDVSSPFILAYVLSRDGRIIKTDINPYEEKRINKTELLEFRHEDATRLSFPDNSFDFVYSISVIEHIYDNYIDAIREIVRVTRPGCFIYITLPVAADHVEEWIDNDIYSDQFKRENKIFFQYRFNERDVNDIISSLDGTEIIEKCLYWEKYEGRYDEVMNLLRKFPRHKQIQTIVCGVVNFIAGFTLLDNVPADFKSAKSFGNLSLLLRKDNDRTNFGFCD